MWVSIALTIALIIAVCVFMTYASFIALWHQEAIDDLTKEHAATIDALVNHQRASIENIVSHHEMVVNKLIDGPKLPEVPQMMEAKAADEEWVASPESIIHQGDDLSPIYDPDE
jgi:hypothetical protein